MFVLISAKRLMQSEYIWNLIGKKLSGEATDEELSALERLLRANPDLHYPIQTIMDFWDPGPDGKPEETQLALERHLERMRHLGADWELPSPDDAIQTAELSKKAKKITLRNRLLGVSITGAVLGIVLLFTRNHQRTEQLQFTATHIASVNSEISTRNGSKTNVILPDGSRVWLNAGSKLSYDKNYGNTNREINLTGEAFFDVIHNPEKPFIIHTSKMDIRVLGTRFNIRSYPADKTMEATLIRGSLEVSLKDQPSQKIILKPNEKIVVANVEKTAGLNIPTLQKSIKPVLPASISKLTYEPTSGDIVEISWVENKLIFQDQPFKDLAEQMERWFGVIIRFKDKRAEELRFTGSFKNETIQQALEALQLSGKFDYSIHENQIVIYDN